MKNDTASVIAEMHKAWSKYAIDLDSINSDDYYVIDGNHELVAHFGSKQPEPVPRPGQRVLRGMQLRSVDKPPVWQIPSVPAFLWGAV